MKYFNSLAAIVCLLTCAYLLTDKFTSKQAHKIGIIQMDKLVYDYKGMKEASKTYSDKMKKWGEESDSLERNLKSLYKQIRIDSLQGNKEQLGRHVQTFILCREKYQQHMGNIDAQAKKQDQQMTVGVLNQVTESIRAYAEKEGFDVILTNTQQQSVGYVKDRIDVTEAVLAFANQKYDGL